MQSTFLENWQVRKPTVTSQQGLVASQHHLASDVGADILRCGGNAIDAAIATGLALGTVEPWMSGIGGGGYMTIYLAQEKTVRVVEFGMRAPFDSTSDDYPLAPTGKNSPDAFDWPKVEGDVNVHGPLSIAVPGYLRGMELALNEFGTLPFDQVIGPACRYAEWGLPIDWYSALKITTYSRELARYETTRNTYLADGLPPSANLDGSVKPLALGQLASTYRHLQAEGPGSYYSGPLGEKIVADLNAAGSKISLKDLGQYKARIASPLTTHYRDSELFVAGELTAGPSIIQALSKLAVKMPDRKASPDAESFRALAESLFETYDYRLKELGEGNIATPGNTSHICAVDKEGNVVSLTQTIMSAFGSRIMLPQTGVLMNNGMMWFDPRPGGPNSVLGGRYPLCNMCPVIGIKQDGRVFAAGACGGRKIFPAIFQLASFLIDNEMSIEQAAHQPRIDVSGNEWLTIMDSMPAEVIADLQKQFANVRVLPNGVYPTLFALPQLIQRDAKGTASGACFVPSPHAKVSRAD